MIAFVKSLNCCLSPSRLSLRVCSSKILSLCSTEGLNITFNYTCFAVACTQLHCMCLNRKFWKALLSHIGLLIRSLGTKRLKATALGDM